MSVLIGLVAGAPAAAQTHPDLSGIWEHSAISKMPFDPPAPVPAIAAKMQAARDRALAGQVVSGDSAFCRPAGMPFMMSGSEGFDLVQGKHEIAIINEERPSPRHLYLDRQHPPLDEFDPTSVGHSIAHWEKDVLVVDTVGFMAPLQDGGWAWRSPTTHLVERFHLEQKGTRLRVSFRWEDPNTLTKPYTYEYLMEKAPADRYAFEYYCDAGDPERTRMVGR